MVNERPQQFSGTSRFGAIRQPGHVRPPGSSPTASRATQKGLGLGKGSGGLGKGKGGLKRHQKVQRDTIYGVTKGDIRRLARRGGVKRISATLYDDVRQALKERLTDIMRQVIAIVELSGRKTICVTDIIFILNRQGRTLYGYDPAFNASRR